MLFVFLDVQNCLSLKFIEEMKNRIYLFQEHYHRLSFPCLHCTHKKSASELQDQDACDRGSSIVFPTTCWTALSRNDENTQPEKTAWLVASQRQLLLAGKERIDAQH